ncbi:hypothetical protein KW791_02950 [Candidatus Parcubacteria bacterium]|nr:hypothetical protein [Candidatus Parcubacteria bacterium]
MSKTPQELHNEGQRDGSQSDAVEQTVHYFFKELWNEDYKKGYENGVANPASDDTKKEDEGGCFLTSACILAAGLPDNCAELTVLRRFRDTYMLTFDEGRAEVKEYYLLAPGIVKKISSRPDSQAIYHKIYTEIVVPCVNYIHLGQLELARLLYKQGVKRLAL